jgi:predicted nucleic acid-binding protein
MAFLLDTNVVSELRKKRRNDPKVQAWLSSVSSDDLFTSVIVIGEIRRGIEKVRPADPVFASQLELWLHTFQSDYQDRILSITEEIAEFWGTLCPNDPLPEPDGLIAATALHHGMALVTRNVEHVHRSGVQLLNPWQIQVP